MSIFVKFEVVSNITELFQEAIEAGILSDDETKDNYAGNYMYMYSKGYIHFFKNKDTREYIKYNTK